jgi:hypothetical protein
MQVNVGVAKSIETRQTIVHEQRTGRDGTVGANSDISLLKAQVSGRT